MSRNKDIERIGSIQRNSRQSLHSALLFQDLGYKGEIGYQTFLYSNEPEIRSLLMFLVEKLPRESAEASDQPAGESNTLHRPSSSQYTGPLHHNTQTLFIITHRPSSSQYTGPLFPNTQALFIITHRPSSS